MLINACEVVMSIAMLKSWIIIKLLGNVIGVELMAHSPPPHVFQTMSTKLYTDWVGIHLSRKIIVGRQSGLGLHGLHLGF